MTKSDKRLFFSLKVLITILLFLIPVGLTLAGSDMHDGIVSNNSLAPAGMTTEVGFEPIEVVSMRTAISKTYDNGDGSYKAVVYIKPIHYEDETGHWVEFDESKPISGTRSREIASLQPGPSDGKDAMISTSFGSAGNENLNTGADEAIWLTHDVSTSTGFFPFRGLYKFNIDSLGIPSDADINSATLMIYYYYSMDTQSQQNGQSSSIAITAYPLSRDWVEGTGTFDAGTTDGACWNSYDGTNTWTTAGGDYASSPTGSGSTPSSYGYTSVSITNIVKGWISGSITNYGTIIKGDTSHEYLKQFYSSDHSSASQRPKLEIDYVSNYPPEIHKAFPFNRFEMVEDHTEYIMLDGNEDPVTGLFRDSDDGDSMTFSVWTGSGWADDTGGAFVGEKLTATIMTNGTVEIKPHKDKYGTEVITLNATDESLASTEYDLTVKILAVNDPPKINETTHWKFTSKPEPTISPTKITSGSTSPSLLGTQSSVRTIRT
jgi:hypothetical protein